MNHIDTSSQGLVRGLGEERMIKKQIMDSLSINQTKIMVFFSALFVTFSAWGDYQLACHYYDKTSISQNTSFFHPGLPWVWARGENNEYILATGKKSEGFFEVESLLAKSKSTFSSQQINYKNSYEVALSFCNNALKRAFPADYQRKAVATLILKSSFLSLTTYAPVFPKTLSTYLKNIDRLIIFGDSLSDQGNLRNWLRVFPPENEYFAGRFTNGPIWLDRFQQLTGMAVQNWAVGGSMAKPHEDPEFKKHNFKEGTYLSASLAISGTVQKEIQRYIKNSLKNKRTINSSSSLYLIWIGGNDYLTWMGSSKDVDIFMDQPEHPRAGSHTIIEGVTESIIDNLKALYAAGAREFLLVNLPNMGILPRILDNETYHMHQNEGVNKRLFDLSSKLKKISVLHNRILEQKLKNFAAEHQMVKLHRLDAFHGLENGLNLLRQNEISEDDHFGFDVDFVKSIHYGKRKTFIDRACLTGGVFGAKVGETCTEPNRKKFWDNVHPSSWTHCIMAINFHKNLTKDKLIKDFKIEDYLRHCKPELL